VVGTAEAEVGPGAAWSDTSDRTSDVVPVRVATRLCEAAAHADPSL